MVPSCYKRFSTGKARPVLFGILMDERAASATASASIQRARVPRHEFSRLVRVSAGCLPARLQMTCMYHKKGENGLKTTWPVTLVQSHFWHRRTHIPNAA